MAAPIDPLLDRLAAGDASAAPAIVALAEAGDAAAQYKCAEFALRGSAMPVDLVAARRWMERAAIQGLVEAQRGAAYFVGSGIGGPPDPDRARLMLAAIAPTDRFSAVQLAFLDHVGCIDRLASAVRERISDDPFIEVVRGLFSPAECQYVRMLAAPQLEPAMIYTANGGRVRDPHRDSDNMAVVPMAEDLVFQAINRCIAAATGTPVGNGEPLHVLRYGPGQQYRPHHDAYAFPDIANRRQLTAILYCNDDYGGGETEFPELRIRVRGQTGDLLVFRNLDDEAMPDPRLLHAGRPVDHGEKWIATRWIKCGDYFGRNG